MRSADEVGAFNCTVTIRTKRKIAPPRGIFNPTNPVSTTTTSKSPVVPDSHTILRKTNNRLANKIKLFLNWYSFIFSYS